MPTGYLDRCHHVPMSSSPLPELWLRGVAADPSPPVERLHALLDHSGLPAAAA